MKVAVITASIGGYDPQNGIPRQVFDGEVDFYYYHDGNLPYPLTNLNSRYKARYLKCNSHRFLPDYDVFIWLDGRVKIEGNNFVQQFIEDLGDKDMAIYKHRNRKSVYEEVNFIAGEVTKGTPYLVERYGHEALTREILFYKQMGLPENYPLFMGGIFARRNTSHVNQAFEDWFIRLTEFSNSDQTMLSLICHQYNLQVNAIKWDEARSHKLFVVGKHSEAMRKDEIIKSQSTEDVND